MDPLIAPPTLKRSAADAQLKMDSAAAAGKSRDPAASASDPDVDVDDIDDALAAILDCGGPDVASTRGGPDPRGFDEHH